MKPCRIGAAVAAAVAVVAAAAVAAVAGGGAAPRDAGTRRGDAPADSSRVDAAGRVGGNVSGGAVGEPRCSAVDGAVAVVGSRGATTRSVSATPVGSRRGTVPGATAADGGDSGGGDGARGRLRALWLAPGVGGGGVLRSPAGVQRGEDAMGWGGCSKRVGGRCGPREGGRQQEEVDRTRTTLVEEKTGWNRESEVARRRKEVGTEKQKLGEGGTVCKREGCTQRVGRTRGGGS